MTVEEVIQEIELFLKLNGEDLRHCGSMVGALKNALFALEKQLPKKPIVVDEDCPSCGEPMNAHYNFCPICGQALDWSDKK